MLIFVDEFVDRRAIIILLLVRLFFFIYRTHASNIIQIEMIEVLYHKSIKFIRLYWILEFASILYRFYAFDFIQ